MDSHSRMGFGFESVMMREQDGSEMMAENW